MQVTGISFSSPNFKSGQTFSKEEALYPFLYTAKEDYVPKGFNNHKIDYIGGAVAVCLAILSLKKFFTKSTIPQSVVELKNPNSGLGKLDFGMRTSALLKENILYPMKAILMGDTRLLNRKLKTGLIIADNDKNKLKNYIKAFLTHARALGIHVEELKYPDKKQPLKEVYKALENAEAYYKSKGICTIVNIGDLGKISNLSVGKFESSSNIEKRLASMPKGVLWVAHTTSGDKLPYFYNNIPTLSVKIVD